MLIVWKAPCVRMERIGRQSRHHDRLTERIAVWATVPPSRVPEEPEILATYWRGPIEPRHFYITTDVYIPKAKRPRWRQKKKRERIKTVLQSQCLPSTNSHDRPGSRRNRIAGVLFQEGWKVGNFIYIFLLSLKANEDSIDQRVDRPTRVIKNLWSAFNESLPTFLIDAINPWFPPSIFGFLDIWLFKLGRLPVFAKCYFWEKFE